MKGKNGRLMVCVFLIILLGAGAAFAAGKKEAAASTAGSREPITFTVFSSDLNNQYEDFESPVAQKIRELTGVTLRMEYPVGDSGQRVALMAAAGDYPDLLFAKAASNIVVDAGGYIDMTSYIERLGSNIRKMYGRDLVRLRWSLDDPSVYILNSNAVGQQDWTPPHGFQLQHAVVRELGYPEIRTVQDFENAIRTYYERHPTIDGNPTIPWTLNADGWRILITVTNPAVFATGGFGDDGEWFVDQDTLKPMLHHRRPEEKEYFRWVNHMFHSGLLDPESFTQKHDQYVEKIASGRVLGLSDAAWQINQPQTALRQVGMDERTYGFFPVTLNDSIEYNAFYPAGTSFGWGVGITVKNSDPERAFEFLDWTASDEAQILNHWGLEGVHYRYENGRRVQFDEVRRQRATDEFFGRKTGIGVFAYPFPRYGRGIVDPSGNTYTPETVDTIIANYTPVEKEVLSAYGATMWRDMYKTDFGDNVKPYGYAWQLSFPSDTEGAVIWQRVQEINWRRIPQAIMAAPADFDRVWDAYQREIVDAGVLRMEAQFEEMLRSRLELWAD